MMRGLLEAFLPFRIPGLYCQNRLSFSEKGVIRRRHSFEYRSPGDM